MGTHSNLKRFVCLAVVLTASVFGIAYEAQAGGGLKGGATTASTGSVSNPLKVGATSVLNVNPRVGPPPVCGKGGCGGPKR
jgi:hypothetical protein